jgi:hypothetical protein
MGTRSAGTEDCRIRTLGPRTCPTALAYDEERDAILALGKDLKRIWFAPATSDRDRKELLRTLLHWEIPCFEPKLQVQDGECMTIEKAARALGIAPSTLHRCLNNGFIAGEQITPGAQWRIRINDELRSRFVESAPEGYVKMFKAMESRWWRGAGWHRPRHGEPGALLQELHVARAVGIDVGEADKEEAVSDLDREVRERGAACLLVRLHLDAWHVGDAAPRGNPAVG